MQNIEELKKKENEKTKESKSDRGGFFKCMTERLKQKDERQVRQRLARVVKFCLSASVAYLAGGAELFFGTFPISLALACSSRGGLIPAGLGLLVAVIGGFLPPLYGYCCVVVLLVRMLSTLLPAVYHTLGQQRAREGQELIKYAPHAIERSDKQGDFDTENELPTNTTHEQDSQGGDENILANCFGRMFCEDLHIKMLCGALGGFICGLFFLLESNFSFYSLCATVTMMAGTPLTALLLGGYWGEGRYKRQWYSFLSKIALIGLCVYAAQGKTVLGMPMAPLLAMLLTLYVTSDKGILAGGVTGLICGLAFDVIYIPLLLITAILFGLVSAVKRNAGVAAVCALIVVWCYYIGGESGLVGVLPPMLLALPLYMLADKYREMMNAPYRRMAALSDGLFFAEAVTEKTKNEAVKERLNALSDAFTSLSETFYKLSDRFRRPDVLGLKRITDQAFEKTCEGCRNRELCWGADYAETLDAIRCVTADLHTKGTCMKESLPESFLSRCIRAEKLVETVNHTVAETTERIIKSGKNAFFAANYDDITAILEDALAGDAEEYECDIALGEKVFDYLYAEGMRVGGVVVYGKRCRHVVAKGSSLSDGIRAEQISEICRRVSELVGVEMTEPVFDVGKDGTVMLMYSSPTVKARCAHGRLSQAGREWSSVKEHSDGQDQNREFIYVDPFEGEDETCGDITDAFITDNSYFYALISDGMGSGPEAAYTSGVCAMFIEKMLSAGNRADVTLRMLNNVIRSENMGCGSECSATVDLVELDLMSGVASFIKSGAAPTYIARGDTVYKISARTMPVGIIKDADARITKFDTKKGDIIVMMSDGCCPDSEDCPWLVEYLCNYMSGRKRTVEVGEDLCERLKDDIIREAVKNFPEGKERDDISVSVVLVG